MHIRIFMKLSNCGLAIYKTRDFPVLGLLLDLFDFDPKE
jgi:hypothetical protein